MRPFDFEGDINTLNLYNFYTRIENIVIFKSGEFWRNLINGCR